MPAGIFAEGRRRCRFRPRSPGTALVGQLPQPLPAGFRRAGPQTSLGGHGQRDPLPGCDRPRPLQRAPGILPASSSGQPYHSGWTAATPADGAAASEPCPRAMRWSPEAAASGVAAVPMIASATKPNAANGRIPGDEPDAAQWPSKGSLSPFSMARRSVGSEPGIAAGPARAMASPDRSCQGPAAGGRRAFPTAASSAWRPIGGMPATRAPARQRPDRGASGRPSPWRKPRPQRGPRADPGRGRVIHRRALSCTTARTRCGSGRPGRSRRGWPGTRLPARPGPRRRRAGRCRG